MLEEHKLDIEAAPVGFEEASRLGGTSPHSALRRCSSSAMSSDASRDQPSLVLKLTMRIGLLYCPSIRRLATSGGSPLQQKG
ncbi:hypothetical protein ABID65_008505 [Bradyrhizobium sp. S3.9.2]